MGRNFSPLSYDAANVSTWTCSIVALWWLLELVCMLLLLGEGESDSSILLSYLGLQPLPHWVMLTFDGLEKGLMGEARWNQLFGSVGPAWFSGEIWFGALTLQAVSTCLVLWLVRILGEELGREVSGLSILCTAWIPWQISSEEFHPSFHYGSIVINVCKVL